MYTVVASHKFQKDYKLCKKRGLKMELINNLILELEKSGKVPDKHKPHLLKVNYKGLWECHIQPDWLLVGKKDEELNLLGYQDRAQITIEIDYLRHSLLLNLHFFSIAKSCKDDIIIAMDVSPS